MGCFKYSDATRLLLTVDGGGSNGSWVLLWKREIQSLANELGISINVRHFSPGISKWNKIEHQMVSFMSENWGGRPLESLGTILFILNA
jgi:hypothetical protein